MNPPVKLYTTSEIAEALHLCESAVIRLVSNGSIPRPATFAGAFAWTEDDLEAAQGAYLALRRKLSPVFDAAMTMIDAAEAGEQIGTASNLLNGQTPMIDAKQLAEKLNITRETLRDYLRGRLKPRLHPTARVKTCHGVKMMFSAADILEWCRAVRARKWAADLVASTASEPPIST